MKRYQKWIYHFWSIFPWISSKNDTDFYAPFIVIPLIFYMNQLFFQPPAQLPSPPSKIYFFFQSATFTGIVNSYQRIIVTKRLLDFVPWLVVFNQDQAKWEVKRPWYRWRLQSKSDLSAERLDSTSAWRKGRKEVKKLKVISRKNNERKSTSLIFRIR